MCRKFFRLDLEARINTFKAGQSGFADKSRSVCLQSEMKVTTGIALISCIMVHHRVAAQDIEYKKNNLPDFNFCGKHINRSVNRKKCPSDIFEKTELNALSCSGFDVHTIFLSIQLSFFVNVSGALFPTHASIQAASIQFVTNETENKVWEQGYV